MALMRRSENGKVSGTKLLKESQAYPPKLGEAVVDAWLNPEKAAEEADTAGGKDRKKKEKKRAAPAQVRPSWTQPSTPGAPSTSPVSKRRRTSKSDVVKSSSKPSWMRP